MDIKLMEINSIKLMEITMDHPGTNSMAHAELTAHFQQSST